MKQFRVFWAKISSIGTAHPRHVALASKVKLSNQIVITISCLMIVMAFAYKAVPFAFYSYLFAPLTYGAVLLMNHLGFFRISRVFFVLSAVCGTTVIAGVLTDTHLFASKIALVSTIILPVLLYGVEEIKSMLVGVAFILISFLGMDYLVAYIPMVPEAVDADFETNSLFITINALVSVVMLTSAYFYLQLIIKENQWHLAQKNDLLSIQKAEIEQLNNDLAQKVEDVLENLSQSNSALKIKMDKIQQFVFHNSHILRQPICNVIGLLELAKHAPAEELSSLIASIELEIDKLEKLTKESDNLLKEK